MNFALRPLVTPLLAASALLFACGPGTPPPADTGSGSDAVADTPAPPTDTPAAADAPPPGDTGGRYAPAGFTVTPDLSPTPIRMFASAQMVLEANRDYAAVIETDIPGRIVLDLTEMQTPITVNSFVFLARNHYFDGIAFHRVIDGFVAQGGDPNTLNADRATWGTGGPGYSFGLEIVSGLDFSMRGVLGMARTSDPNSNGSQFYITLAPTPSLNGMYTVFGHVIEGDSVLDQLARNATMSTPPVTPTRMTQVYIVERPR